MSGLSLFELLIALPDGYTFPRRLRERDRVMGRSSVAYTRFDISSRKGKNIKESYSVDEIEDGYGVLPYFKSFLSFVQADDKTKRIIKDEYHQRIYAVKEINAWGCVVAATILSGTYGDEIKLINMATGEDRDMDSEDAAGRECTLVLACPRDYKTAEFAVEYRGSDNGLPVAIVFLKQLRALFKNLTAQLTPIVESQEWLEKSTLEELSIPVRTVPCKVRLSEMDGPEDGDQDEDIEETGASLRLVLTPDNGSAFSKPFKDKILKAKLKKSAYLCLPEIIDEEFKIEETPIQATVSADKRTKRFLIGQEKTPSIREMLTDFGEPYLSVRKFTDKAADGMLDHFGANGVKVKSGWDRGPQACKDLPSSPEWSDDLLLIKKKSKEE